MAERPIRSVATGVRMPSVDVGVRVERVGVRADLRIIMGGGDDAAPFPLLRPPSVAGVPADADVE